MTGLQVATARASSRLLSEDRLVVEELPLGLLVVVADGAGGLSGGARAAELFVEHVRLGVASNTFDCGAEHTWADVLLDADRLIAADPAAGEATGIALFITSAAITGASAGDSEAWLVTGDNYEVLTVDQGRKRLGSGRAVPVAFSAPVASGTLLVATDGLFAYATPEGICEVVRRADVGESAQRLVALVRLPSGGLADDVAVVSVRLP